jgi:hypothetical protein
MHHTGQLLKKAIDQSGYSVSSVAKELGVATSTVFRWFDVPNLPVKKLVDINRAVPIINLKAVYEALEEKLGHEIPENPYRKDDKKVDTDPGIKISIDTEKFAGYAIPPDLTEKVREYIEEYQKKEK